MVCMKTYLKKIFTSTCPECNEALSGESDALGYIKVCPQGHYKEETYSAFEVKIIYTDLK